MALPKWIGEQGYSGRYSGWVKCKNCGNKEEISSIGYFLGKVLPDKCPKCGYIGEDEKSEKIKNKP